MYAAFLLPVTYIEVSSRRLMHGYTQNVPKPTWKEAAQIVFQPLQFVGKYLSEVTGSDILPGFMDFEVSSIYNENVQKWASIPL